ncbi:MAG: phage holin family protein [Clostridiales bacterium]|nr:phage holin family protein [Clostridiales bacterium]
MELKIIMKLLTKWLICFGALLVAAACFPGQFSVFGGIFSLAAAATVLWLVNLAIRPILQLVSFPITLLTFGLFSVVINAGMVRLTDWLIPVIHIRGFFLCLIIALMISVANTVLAVNRRC